MTAPSSPVPPSHTPQPTATRSLPLGGAIVIGMALVGFLQGIAEPPPQPAAGQSSAASLPESTRQPASEAAQAVPAAVAYRDLPAAGIQANAGWQQSLKDLQSARPGLFDPVQRTPAMKQAALADRARTRAFEGAPPVIPHAVEQQSAASCLACHGQGLQLGDRVATRISHAHFSSCTQCHVEQRTATPFTGEPIATNDFRGIDRSGPGARAGAGAPPTIPHPLWLRDDCLSCHGLVARPGLRTTHPWLSNCVQCHAAAAHLDQIPFARNLPAALPPQ